MGILRGDAPYIRSLTVPTLEKSGIFAGFFAEKNGMTKKLFSCILLCEEKKTQGSENGMTHITRVGELVIIEYLTKEQEDLYKPFLTERQQKQRNALELERKEAYAEVRKQYGRVLKGEFVPKEDPMGLEFHKCRNKNSLYKLYLGI